MKTINFTARDNENLNPRNEKEIQQRVARILEKFSDKDVLSVECDGDNIIEYHIDEKNTVVWSISNINYNDDDTIDNVQIDC